MVNNIEAFTILDIICVLKGADTVDEYGQLDLVSCLLVKANFSSKDFLSFLWRAVVELSLTFPDS